MVQFVGLRGVHPTISAYQVGSVLLMSILRASLRAKRLDERFDMVNILASGSGLNGSQ